MRLEGLQGFRASMAGMQTELMRGPRSGKPKVQSTWQLVRCTTCGCGSKPMGSHFGVGAPSILVYFSRDWDVHWGYDLDFELWLRMYHLHLVSQFSDSS